MCGLFTLLKKVCRRSHGCSGQPRDHPGLLLIWGLAFNAYKKGLHVNLPHLGNSNLQTSLYWPYKLLRSFFALLIPAGPCGWCAF